MMKFKKKIIFTPAWDKRNPDYSKDYGIHCVDVGFFLVGEKGTIQFKFSTGWFLSHVRDELLIKNSSLTDGVYYPVAVDIGYHSPLPMYEDQDPITGECEYVKGDKCYYDGSILNAQAYLDLLIKKGSAAVWRKMKEYYMERFEKDENASISDDDRSQ